MLLFLSANTFWALFIFKMLKFKFLALYTHFFMYTKIIFENNCATVLKFDLHLRRTIGKVTAKSTNLLRDIFLFNMVTLI